MNRWINNAITTAALAANLSNSANAQGPTMDQIVADSYDIEASGASYLKSLLARHQEKEIVLSESEALRIAQIKARSEAGINSLKLTDEASSGAACEAGKPLLGLNNKAQVVVAQITDGGGLAGGTVGKKGKDAGTSSPKKYTLTLTDRNGEVRHISYNERAQVVNECTNMTKRPSSPGR